MLASRQAGVAVALLASCTGCGGLAMYSKQPVELVAVRTDSAQPVANKMVQLHYVASNFEGRPGSQSTSTDDQGRVVLAVANDRFPASVQIERATFTFTPELARAGGVVQSNNDEPVMIRLAPRRRTLIDRFFGYGCYSKGGIM